MDNSKEAIVSTENDDTESTDSSLCIIMAEELDQETNPNAISETDATDRKDDTDAKNEEDMNCVSPDNDTHDSFSAMTQSQYAQVRESWYLSINQCNYRYKRMTQFSNSI